jgi:predicted metalloprotease with PDZ domain
MKTLLRSAALCALLAASTAHAQQGAPLPQPTPMPPPIPAPQDRAFAGTIKLDIDATDIDRRIFRVKETIPAKPGPTILLFPSWLPGDHSPAGELEKMAGLVIKAGGKTIPWRRDPADVWAFHVDVPTGVEALNVEFQYVTPTTEAQGRVVATQEMLNLQWNSVSLYPAGYYARRIMVEPSVKLPKGWKYGTALETTTFEGGLARFKTVDFDTLVDSPMFAGRYYRQIDLDPGGRSPVRLNIVADNAQALEATPEQIEIHREMVRQADKLYGARHYNHYDFLLSLTDRMGGIGLEHHRSSEDGVSPDYFTDWASNAPERDLLTHEYTHSWNGKYRRPADLWTPNFNVPMRDSLLWVYEGQTQYWGNILASRAGLRTTGEGLEELAMTAATYDAQIGRTWRPVEDTTMDPIIADRRPQPWRAWQRSEDYYQEGQLVWLDADTLIRERSGGKRSLDDFAKAFFGVYDGSWTPYTYSFEDVVAALNKIEPYDWATFLRTRIYDVAPKAPLDGLARGGYRLVFTDTPTGLWKQSEAARHATNLTYSLGVGLSGSGVLTSVLWDSPAFKAGLTSGMSVVSVGGEAYSAERIKAAITAGKSGAPIKLLIKAGEAYKTVEIDYKGGLRYPRLERIVGTPDRLSEIYAKK